PPSRRVYRGGDPHRIQGVSPRGDYRRSRPFAGGDHRVASRTIDRDGRSAGWYAAARTEHPDAWIGGRPEKDPKPPDERPHSNGPRETESGGAGNRLVRGASGKHMAYGSRSDWWWRPDHE